MIRTKWIVDTKIAQKVHKDKIKEYRLNQKTEKFELLIEYDDCEVGSLTASWGTTLSYTVPSSLGMTYSRGYYGESATFIDPDTCSTKDEDGYIVFAKREIDNE